MSDDLYAVNKDLKKQSNEQERQMKIEAKINDWSNSNSLRWGIFAGVGMALYLVLLQITNMNTIALQYLKYIILFGFTAYGLSTAKNHLSSNFTFTDGMKVGGIITLASALTLSVVNVLLFMWTENMAFDKFSVSGTSIENVALISGVLFFEAMVFGLIITFIWLQYIKWTREEIREMN